MCVQFCLSVAEISSNGELAAKAESAADSDINTDVEVASDSTYVVPTNFQEDLNALSIDRVANSVNVEQEEEEEEVSEGESGTDSDDSLSPPSSSKSALLEEAKVAALKGLNDRSGLSAR